MNQKRIIRSDDVLRLKIIILIVYAVLTILMFLQVDESDSSSLNQLVLQLGNIVKGHKTVKDVLLQPEQP